MKNFTLNKLSAEFYLNYPTDKFPEIEQKQDRPYVVLLIQIENNTFALPFRTHIKHNFCYKFSNSGRETDSATGIDFTKAVIVNNPDFIGEETSIDDKEYLELSKKYFFIIKKFKNFLSGYVNFVQKGATPFDAKKYQFSTLKYFHKELNLEKVL